MPRRLHCGQSEFVKVTRARSGSRSSRSRSVIMWLYSCLQMIDCLQYCVFYVKFWLFLQIKAPLLEG
jgi:hypothetical protein